MKSVAFFDLDHTLIDGTSAELFLDWHAQECGKHPLQNKAEFAFHISRYRLLDVDPKTLLAETFRPWKGHNIDAFRANIHAYLKTKSARLAFRKDALRVIEEHRRHRHDIVIATASFATFIRPLVTEVRPDAILASELAIENETLTGDIARLLYRQDKADAMRHYLDKNGGAVERAYFYSDSHHDLPGLDLVHYPFAVTPDFRLRRMARKQQWPILNWK